MAQNNFASEVHEYKDVLKEKAEDLVLEGFPKKIVEFNQLLKTPLFKKNKANIPENLDVDIPEMIDLVKPHIWELIENVNLVEMWITFMIPKVEGGKTFTVSILQDTLAKVGVIEKEVTYFFELILQYWYDRGLLLSKVAKYPQIEDYRRTIADHDEEMYYSLCHIMCEMRNRYGYLHDLVIKNLEAFQTYGPGYYRKNICIVEEL